MDDYILPLSETTLREAPAIGAKAALLGELIHREYPVPAGFCLTTHAYKDFLKASEIQNQVDGFRGLSDEQQIAEAAEGIQRAIEDAPIPADLAVGLSTLYRTMGQRPRVVVRPSVAYGTALRSAATGKLESYTNIVGEKDLFQAVRSVWASLWNPDVVASYRRQGIDHASLVPGVIVQTMVRPISSGDVLTADPVTGEYDKLLITAYWGMKQLELASQLVPDAYHVDRTTLALRFKRIVTKELMVSSAGLVPVPKNKRNAVVLKDAGIRDLCQMATGIEDILQGPVELEWCVLQGGAFQVIEALPVEFEVDAEFDAKRFRAVPLGHRKTDDEPAVVAEPTRPAAPESPASAEPATADPEPAATSEPAEPT